MLSNPDPSEKLDNICFNRAKPYGQEPKTQPILMAVGQWEEAVTL